MIELKDVKVVEKRPEAILNFFGAEKSFNDTGTWYSSNLNARILSIHPANEPFLETTDKVATMFERGDSCLAEFKLYKGKTFFVTNIGVVFIKLYVDKSNIDFTRHFRLYVGDSISTEVINKYLADHADLLRKKEFVRKHGE